MREGYLVTFHKIKRTRNRYNTNDSSIIKSKDYSIKNHYQFFFCERVQSNDSIKLVYHHGMFFGRMVSNDQINETIDIYLVKRK